MRCFTAFDCTLHPAMNWFVGNNATGKTTLLESLYYVLSGRSFRVRDTRVLIQEHQPYCVVHAVGEQPAVTVDVLRARGASTRVHVDGVALRKWSDVAIRFPVLFIDTHTHRQFAEQVEMRRTWFNWIMFHVKHSYGMHCASYKKGMEQRMHALRHGADPAPWEHVMAEHANILDNDRRDVMAMLCNVWNSGYALAQRVSISYAPGYAATQDDLMAVWRQQRQDDLRSGYTHSGPHRYDIICNSGVHVYSHRLSLGQQKVLVTHLMLLAARVVRDTVHKHTLWLMDDVSSELDADNMCIVVEEIASLGLQSVITSLHNAWHPPQASVQGMHSIGRTL